jgi:AcrR family transcriptional regulator
MVRPRFAKLPPAQQQAILRAALDEFAAHGFHDASLNRIIEAAGISKGSMYYYFDGKQDLFTHVTRVEFAHLLADVGPVALPAEPGPDTHQPPHRTRRITDRNWATKSYKGRFVGHARKPTGLRRGQ